MIRATRPRGAVPRARPRGRSLHPEPLGAGLRAPDRAPAARLPQTALRLNPGRRNLHQDPRPVALSVPGHRQARKPGRLPAHGEARPGGRQRFFRKALQDQPLLSPDRIGTDGTGSYPLAIVESRKAGLLARAPVHYITKHLQQGIESDHFRVKRPMPRIGGFQAFHTARRTIRGFEDMLWLRKGFGFAGAWTVCEQNRLLALCFGLPEVNKM